MHGLDRLWLNAQRSREDGCTLSCSNILCFSMPQSHFILSEHDCPLPDLCTLLVNLQSSNLVRGPLSSRSYLCNAAPSVFQIGIFFFLYTQLVNKMTDLMAAHVSHENVPGLRRTSSQCSICMQTYANLLTRVVECNLVFHRLLTTIPLLKEFFWQLEV